MAQKTDLNVAPYYDDFDKDDNFKKVLFRPGFAVQARELTQLQSTLQDQIEQHSNHIFKEGAMVIPGQLSLNLRFYTLKLATTFASETINPSQYYNATTPVTVTGATTGVKAKVIGYAAATTTEQPLLYLIYEDAGSDYSTAEFQDGENISADAGITHTTTYSSDAASATTYTSSYNTTTGTAAQLASTTGPASRQGSAVKIESGVYYIRGHFVTCSEETLVLDAYDNTPSYRVGFTITETLVTPESDSTLTDNATGSPNYAAKGAHRLKISLALAKLSRSSTSDSTFVQLMDVKSGNIQSLTRTTEYSILEDTLARRTLDESGDYTVRPFQFKVNESVTLNENTGVYSSGATTDDGSTASNSLLAFEISPGKAYVQGYELEKMAPTFKDINKARDFNTVNAGISTFDLGNYVLIKNVYGTPDITFITGETTPFKTIQLYDAPITTRGSANGTRIGVARARHIEYSSGTAGADANNPFAEYKLYLFDIQPFTILTLDGTPSPTLIASHSNGGVQVKGVTSGATGLVYADGTSGATVVLQSVVGTFSAGEKITASDSAETSSIVENSGNTDLTISFITTHTFDQVRSVFMDDDDSSQDFTADISLSTTTTTSSYIVLDGTDSSANNAEDNIIGEQDNLPVGLQIATSAGTGSTLKLAKLQEAEKNISLTKLPKQVVKTLLTATNSGATDTQYTVRRQFIGISNASGVVTFTAGSNETFVSHAEKDYTMSILTKGTGTGQAGDLISIASTMSGGGSVTLTITDNAVLGNAAKVKLTATILKTSVTQKIKTVNLMKQMKVTTGTTDAYGTRPTDKTISLGRSDVFKLVGVFDSESTSTDATVPSLTLGTITGTFTRGEKITGSSSGATARIIDISSPMSYVLIGTTDFTTSDTITGASSDATAAVSAVTAGSIVVTNRYLLDTGMRDNYYDIARIVRKVGSSSPTGRLLVVYDYMDHGSGDVMTVDSYTDIADQMTYDDIPTYAATKIDPDAPKPTGLYPLYDAYDFRPRVEDIAGTSATLEDVDEVTGNSFDFYSRQYDGTGSSTVDFPKPGSSVQSDFEYYLPKRASVHLSETGVISVTEGTSAEFPLLPKPKELGMKLADLHLPAYTFKPADITVSRQKNQRFTMKDIGKLEDRLDHVEYYTALNMLERDAESFEVVDVNGLNRFKSGFVVDNFAGHRVGDVKHVDYKCAIDMENNELRPKYKMKNIGLEENVSTDTDRASAGYKKTGDLITLPYSEITFTEQPYATTTERVTPFLTSSWVGRIELAPSADEWFETEIAPELVINVDGNFDAVTAAAENQIGTVWNAWQTQWSGVVSQRNLGNINTGGMIFNRSIQTIRTDLARTGIETKVVAQIDRESQGFRVISRAMLPFCRSNTITFTGSHFKPNTRLYPYFNKQSVGSYVTPSSGFSSDSTIVAGSPLISATNGKVEGTFTIPDPKISGNPKFSTGEVQFRLTSSSDNTTSTDPVTAGDAIYFAKGILETEQETIIATRNAIITQETVTQTTSQTSTRSTRRFVQQDNEQPGLADDPLAQTFNVSSPNLGGRFLTSVDIYFNTKDDTLPVTLELRNTVNGYPGPKILPFGRVTKYPADVNISSTAATATTFTFPSPVYVKEGTEYCIVLLAKTPDYSVWISRMGETEIGGTRTVSEQPHIGVLFKGHNNTAWAMSPTEDLKYTLKCAEFTTTAGTVTLQNKVVDAKTLENNPLIFSENTTLKVKHRDHGMYNTTNNVTIDNVKSSASTTLNGSITSTATSLTLTSGTNFDDTSGKYSKTASNEWWLKIGDEIMKYTTISGTAVSSITRAQDSTTAASHADGATVELYQLHKVPFTEINKTFTAIGNIEIDSYTVTLSSTPVIDGSGGSAENGGSSVTATENHMIDAGQTIIGTLELPDTQITAKIRPTTATSPDGSETSFSATSASNAISIPINDNYKFDVPYMVNSSINETNELSGAKSLFIPITLSSNYNTISPVIDTQRMSWISVGNRLDNVDSSSDVYPTGDYTASTEPDGDNNSAIYLTKKVTLDNPATALKIIFAAHRPATSEIKLLYKILRTDDASDFDDLGYTFFNTTGVDDNSTSSSLDIDDFQEYIYTAGVTDDGIGDPLEEFISFQIKIVMQGTNSSEPPRIKDLRALALVT